MLRLQVRALLMAGQGHDLKIMFPMIADVDEYRRARDIVELEKAYLLARGHELPNSLKLGAMIEIPALIWQLDQLLPHRRFRLDRVQRSGAVPLCLGSRQPAPRRPL